MFLTTVSQKNYYNFNHYETIKQENYNYDWLNSETTIDEVVD